mmetsp:Transcript_40298/g.67350  ORF Transcript_40298/g.67350 Transcript_40298/m.67350 type:complete len:868 (+) Transcript_40298:234-2837(+)
MAKLLSTLCFAAAILFFVSSSLAVAETTVKVDSNLRRVLEQQHTDGLRSAQSAPEFHNLRTRQSAEDGSVHVLVEIFLVPNGNADFVSSKLQPFDSPFSNFHTGNSGSVFTSYIPLHSIASIANLKDVRYLRSVGFPKMNRLDPGLLSKARESHRSQSESPVQRTAFSITQTGTALNDQAYPVMKVDQARSRCPVLRKAGQNITIGIISDSFNAGGGLQEDIANGFLPGVGNPFGYSTPVYIALEYIPESGQRDGTDEGRAMAQLVHAFAPYAKLCFATAAYGEASIASYIIRLAGPPCNADIIVDDVRYANEGYYQDTEWAEAVDTVAINSGVHYYSAAGNSGGNEFLEQTFSPKRDNSIKPNYWMHEFNATSVSPFLLPVNPDVYSQVQFFMQWNDKIGDIKLDLDIFILSVSGSQITLEFELATDNRGPGDPFQGAMFQNVYDTMFIAVGVRTSLPIAFSSRTKFVFYTFSGTIATDASQTITRSIFGHAAARQCSSIGAYSYDPVELEPYSSAGPATLYYDSIGTALVPPEVRYKPDFCGVDCTDTSFFSPDQFHDETGLYIFCGTSAAAPHVAAVAGLVLQAAGGRRAITPSQMRSIFYRNSEFATWSADRGYGLVDALRATIATGGCSNSTRTRTPSPRRTPTPSKRLLSATLGKSPSRTPSRGKSPSRGKTPTQGKIPSRTPSSRSSPSKIPLKTTVPTRTPTRGNTPSKGPTPLRSRTPVISPSLGPTSTPEPLVCLQSRYTVRIGSVFFGSTCPLPLSQRPVLCGSATPALLSQSINLLLPSASFSYSYTVSTQGSTFDTIIEVYRSTSTCPRITCNDNFRATNQSSVTFSVASYERAVLRIGGKAQCGDLQITISRR